jgi:hypothetical protein
VKQTVTEVKESIKTTDEWVTDGLRCASIAEAPERSDDAIKHARFWLAHALKRFQNGKNKVLERAVQIHQESIRLRTEEYPTWTRNKIESDKEFEVMMAQHLSTLASEGLLKEASEFFSVVRFLFTDFTRMVLEERLFPLLPEIDQDE